jgi:hypothetical protein
MIVPAQSTPITAIGPGPRESARPITVPSHDMPALHATHC